MNRVEMQKTWQKWFEDGHITEEELMQYKKSCQNPRKVYQIDEIPEELEENSRGN
jgi:hypothetical protein